MVYSTITFLCAIILDVCIMLTHCSGSLIWGPGLNVRCIEWVLYVGERLNEVVADLTNRAYTTAV